MELFDYEIKHISYLEKCAHECTLFLKKDNTFPMQKPCKIALFGNGARNTIKGGTGSGDVASRFFVNFQKGLEDAGFEITTNEWLDKYDEFRKHSFKEYVRDGKKAAHKYKILAGVFTMGYFEEEKNYPFEPDGEGELCVYILSRNSGEGNDRRPIKGDVYLSDREVKDINYLYNKFQKFLLVLNVGGVVDLSKVSNVKNILYISQLGVVTGTVLPNIILGKVNPSGKLSTTWTLPEEYPFFNEFGDVNDTYYKEGIYVGYRYFDSVKKDVLFPFGYGLSYSDFEINHVDVTLDRTVLNLKVNVKNISNFAGKEVIQTYISCPEGRINKPFQQLVCFDKTRELKENESEILELSFNIKDVASYDESTSSYILEKGKYIVRVGNSSRNTKVVCAINLKENVITEKCSNKCGKSGFEDFVVDLQDENISTQEFDLESSDFEMKIHNYEKDCYVDPSLENLSDRELMLMTLGHHKTGFAAIVGSSCEHIVGGAGETVLCVPQIKKSLTMADGPAGIRLKQIYGVDKKGVYDVVLDPMMEKMIHFLPVTAGPFIKPPKHRHGELHYQYTTAIPIGTALAQSFNVKMVEEIGDLIAEEMVKFGVDLWLAPALNIHRNILCGRNFEYYSEDPLLSGKIAGAMIRGVEKHEGLGVTVKHFACNNQELNRNNNNSHLSERALREIYLKGFEICIKEDKPKALMTSYNLINGIHASECYELLNDILRCEWGYQGLIMTDWIASGRTWCGLSTYKAPYASNNILAGNDLTMSGCPADEKDIMKALKKGKLTREDLLHSASRIYRSIMLQKRK